jgi:hypothetical protein
MSKCPNCGTALSCGCQKRVLANGKQACTKCINSVKNQPKVVNNK